MDAEVVEMVEKAAYEAIGHLFSRSQMKKLGGLLEASGLGLVAEEFAGVMVLLCVFASLAAYFASLAFVPLRSFIFSLAMFISSDATASSQEFFVIILGLFSVVFTSGAICLIAYVMLLLMADARRRKVEDVLPDFLSLSAANVRAGMTIDQAMWYAAKPEFGILSTDISLVAKKTFGGVPFNQSIDYLAERFNSKIIRRSVALIKQGLASGGKLADILERTAEETRQMQIMRKEIATSLLMYVIFIVFAGAFGTPFLFAISSKLVAILEGVFATLPTQNISEYSSSFGSMVMPTSPTVSSSEFFLFTMLSSTVTAIFSALIIGVISKGSKKDGLPYIPVLLIISLLIFFVTSYALDHMLANIYV